MGNEEMVVGRAMGMARRSEAGRGDENEGVSPLPRLERCKRYSPPAMAASPKSSFFGKMNHMPGAPRLPGETR
jgi:hypothetical protein